MDLCGNELSDLEGRDGIPAGGDQCKIKMETGKENKRMTDNRIEEFLDEDEKELVQAAGGGCWASARFVAPDGHDVGCAVSWYRVQFNDLDFCAKFPEICPIDGKAHDNTGRQYCGNGRYLITCKKCGHYLEKDGTFHSGWGVVAD